MELSLIELAAALTVVAAGALVQATIGFGMSIVAAPFLYEINPALVPGPLMMMALGLGVLSLKRDAGHVNFSSLKFAFIGRVPGTFVGAWLLAVASASQMSFILGIVVLLAVLISMTSYKVTATKGNLAVAGFFSGVFGTTSSIGGPPMALIMQNETPAQIRANLAMFFMIGSSFSLVVLAYSGLLGWSSLIYGLSLLPAVGVGFWLAGFATRYVSPDFVRRGLLLVCSLSGTFAIISAIQR